jgi:hypothetical protein
MDTFINNTWKPRLIPRKTLNALHVEQVEDEFNRVTESTTEFTVENAGVHPVPGDKTNALPEGYRDRRAYQVFTTTPLTSANEGTATLHDKVEIDGAWFKVIRVENWQTGLQDHYHAYVTEENER